jgi:hypothetical protein
VLACVKKLWKEENIMEKKNMGGGNYHEKKSW